MSERIEVGDLVMVVRPRTCCGSSDGIGRVGRVVKIYSPYSICPECVKGGNYALAKLDNSVRLGLRISRLKKINGITEPETVIEEATA